MQQHESLSASFARDRAPKSATTRQLDPGPRRTNGHPVGAQLSANAQFKRALIAQRKGPGGGGPGVLEAAASGVEGSGSPLPFLDVIQRSFGHHAVDGVQAFVGGQAKAASEAIGAEAYATGNSVAFRAAPTLHTAAHEAAHIVQQRAGVQLAGGVGQVGDRYERHADAVADRVVQGKSAADLLNQFAGQGSAHSAVQKRDAGVDDAPELDAGVGPTAHVDDPCVAELGGSREYRSAGIASIAELEAYQAECGARAEAEMGDSLVGYLAISMLKGGAEVVVTVAKTAGKGVVGAALGAKRVGKVVWLSLEAYNARAPQKRLAAKTELADMGEVDDELVSFFVDLSAAGMSLQDWARNPDGPLAHIIKQVCQSQIESEALKHSADEMAGALGEAGTAVGRAVARFGVKKLVAMLISGPIVKLALRTTLWAVASAVSTGSAGSLATAARSGFGKWGVTAIGIALAGLGIAEQVTEPRQSLQSKHPELFAFATAHHCAFMWTWIEPQLPALKVAITSALASTEFDHD